MMFPENPPLPPGGGGGGFEWRATSSTDQIEKKTGQEGGLYLCSVENNSSIPTLTLVPPPDTKNTSADTATAFLVAPGPGDDLSPPNSVQAEKINGIAVPVAASAGWSVSPPTNEGVYPSCVAFDVRIKTNNNSPKSGGGSANNINTNDSLELAVALGYTNPRYEYGETMVVKVAVAKTIVQEELKTDLALVSTQFQEYLPETNQWVDITADIDYTTTADAVVNAVMQDSTAGQTAGKASITARTVELTLGPFSAKARLHLTFQADRLYTYEAMSLQGDGADMGCSRVLPLWLNLPFAPVDHEAGLSNLAVRVQAPMGTNVLSMEQNQEAYWDLKNQDSMKETTVLAVSSLKESTSDQDLVGCQFQWESLPFRSTGLVAWLLLPNPSVEESDTSIFDFVHIGRSLEELGDPNSSISADTGIQAQVTLQIQDPADALNLKVPLPGHGPMGSLYRVRVKMPQAQPRQQPCFIANLTLSDKSGSTGRRVGNGSMRQRFNQLAEVRFLKRIESIPALVKANVIQMEDIWMEAFLAFDSTAPVGSIRRILFRVRDVHDSVVETVKAIRAGNVFDANSRLPTLSKYVQDLRGVTPGGATDFSVGPRTLAKVFDQWQKEAQTMASAKVLAPCTFVEFDTDGGHNRGSDYINSLKNLCEVYDVRDGVVTGFGSWLNQDCASRVARVLGSVPALLALQVPEVGTEGLDKVFRTGFSAWVSALRKPPKLTLKLTAGSVSFPSPVTSRNANAVELLGFRRIGEPHDRPPRFGAPDVSEETYTKSVVTDIPAGDELLFYVVSRLSSESLERSLEIQTTVEGSSTPPSRARVWSEDETSKGNFLAYDWLSMLTSNSSNKGSMFQLAPVMAPSLSSRLEDEVSFRFNVPSPSGKTSYLGRSMTVANRAAIDAAHQPQPPSCPIKIPPPTHAERDKEPSHGLVKSPKHQMVPSFQSAAIQVASGNNYSGRVVPRYGNSSNGVNFTTYECHAPEVTRSFGAAQPLFSGAPVVSGVMGGFDPHKQNRMGGWGRGGGGGGRGRGRGRGGGGGFSSARTSASVPCASNNRRRKSGAFDNRERKRGSSDERVVAPDRPRDPSWRDAIAVPLGSAAPFYQNHDKLLQAINQIEHAGLRLLDDPSVQFVCDICGRQILLGEPRYHCFDCQDFDACSNCQNRHNKPFHRVANVNTSPSSLPTTPVEDPLVSSLLPQPQTTSAQGTTLQSGAPEFDQTKEWCKLRVRRFLLSVLHWWPMFRSTCSFCDRLPHSLSDDMAGKIARSINEDSNLNLLLETCSIIVDSLMREAAALEDGGGPQD